MIQKDVVGPVPALGRRGGPATVCDLLALAALQAMAAIVALLVVYSVNGMCSRWAGTHVVEEGHERLSPPSTHPNSFCTVFGKACRVAVIAPGHDVAPHSVLCGGVQWILSRSQHEQFAIQTATAASATLDKMVGSESPLASADALAFPFAFADVAKSSEASKYATAKWARVERKVLIEDWHCFSPWVNAAILSTFVTEW